MQISPLTCISPIDGRYHNKTQPLQAFFSEFALMHYRLLVEVRWLQALAAHPNINEVPELSIEANTWLDQFVTNFSLHDAEAIKQIEKTTNHDVKAVEYFIKDKIKDHAELQASLEFVHFACTSEDINNLAYALMLQAARQQCLLPEIQAIEKLLQYYAKEYATLPMLSRTHGQAASPTTLGKEFTNIHARLKQATTDFGQAPIRGKINGAVGNFNAHAIAYPEVDWIALSRNFVQRLGLEWNAYTTQIEPHDFIAQYAHTLSRINTLLTDCSRDIWSYISLGYFKQRLVTGEVGSSTMPHKVNPIDFENAEGNLGIANALLLHFAQTLPISRWQRDLTDSTVLRNLGVACAHCTIAYQSLIKGLNKLEVNQDALAADLDNNWAVLSEAVQTVMRRYAIPEPYEKLKALTRGQTLDKASYLEFVDTLQLPTAVKAKLSKLTPATYTGLASALALT